MEKKKNKDNKKKRFIIIGIIALVFLVIGFFFCYSFLDTTKPYVKANKIEILDVNKEYSVPVEFYTKDTNGNLIDVPEVTLDKSKANYRFYDYEVSEPDKDGYSVYSFKIEVKAPLTYTLDINNFKTSFRYTFLLQQPGVFDYYTGDLCKEKNVSVNSRVNYYDRSDKIEGDYSFTNIKWKNEEYKIGVRMESSVKWSGAEVVSEENSIQTKKDLDTTSINVFIYAPANYDGLMLSLRNTGTSKKDFINNSDKKKKYDKLLSEYNETGVKSKELEEMEKESNKVYKLLEAADGKKIDKKDIYVFRISDIKPKEK